VDGTPVTTLVTNANMRRIYLPIVIRN
jgi:hypothetical protein